MKFGTIVISVLLFSSCVTPPRVSQPRAFVLPFVLSRETPVAVLVQKDRNSVKDRVEERLNQLGLNIVPVDVAKKVVEIRKASVKNERTESSRAAVEDNKYYPAALIISVEYQTFIDKMGQEITLFLNARFIDTSTQQVLAVASFWREDNTVSMDYTLDKFAQEIAPYIK